MPLKTPPPTKARQLEFKEKLTRAVDRLRKDRDHLRGLLEEYTDVLQVVEDAHEALEFAVETMSTHL